MKRLRIVFLMLLILGVNGHVDVFGQIKSGFAYAGKMLGLDRAGSVAQLVSEAFGRTEPHEKGESESNPIFSGFLRVLGFDTKRVGAMAVNAIIFLAQIISTSLSKPPPAYVTQGRSLDGSPLDWMLENPEVKRTFDYAKNANLPAEIIAYLKEGNLNNNGCIQLLICKCAPFIKSMQRALKTKMTKKGKSVFTQFLPTLEQVADNGDQCEDKYRYCKLHFNL